VALNIVHQLDRNPHIKRNEINNHLQALTRIRRILFGDEAKVNKGIMPIMK
jgi:hypothetical protein